MINLAENISRSQKVFCALLWIVLAVSCSERTVFAADHSFLLLEQTTNLVGAAERLYMLEMRSGEIASNPMPLHGTEPIGDIILTESGRYGVITTGLPWFGEAPSLQHTWTYTTAFETKPLRAIKQPPFLGETGIRTVISEIHERQNVFPPEWIFMTQGTDDRGQGKGELGLLSNFNGGFETHHDIPGQPLQLLLLPESNSIPEQVAVLYRHTDTRAPMLRILSPETGLIYIEHAIQDKLEINGKTEIAQISISSDGLHIWVAVSGFDLTRTGEFAVTWVAAYEYLADQWTTPVQITGMAFGNTPVLYPSGTTASWITTRLPGAQFGYVVLLELSHNTGQVKALHKVEQYALTNIDAPILLSVNTRSKDVAVAWGNRLEIWPDGKRGALESNHFQTDVDFIQLLRSENELFALTQQTLYHLDSNTNRLSEVYVSNNRNLVRAIPLPKGNGEVYWDIEDNDRSVQLNTPATLHFRGEAAGRELQEIHIHPVGPGAAEAIWRIHYDQEAMPWLRLHPRSGRGSGFVYTGIDPGLYEPEKPLQGLLEVTLEAPDDTLFITNSPSYIVIQVSPPASSVLRVLWVWPEESNVGFRSTKDPWSMKKLGDMLAAAPHYMSHREVFGSFQDSLSPYAIVVIGIRAALAGGLTRQALLEYVQAGGALFLIGEYLEDTVDPALQRWLGGVGIQIHAESSVEDKIGTIDVAQEIVLPWSEQLTVQGCLIQASAPVIQFSAMSDSNISLFSAAEYGLGRVAVLAGPTPLESSVVQNEANRRFAESLFRWLSRAGMDGE